MDEDVWLACTDPIRMFVFLRRHSPSPRKVRLFACACARRWLDHDDDTPGPSRRAVEVAELYADGLAPEGELEAAGQNAWEVVRASQSPQRVVAAWATNPDAWIAAVNTSRHTDPASQCAILRDLYGTVPAIA